MKDRIRTVRRNLALTQDEFALLLGLKMSAIQKWEAGKYQPRAKNLRRLAEVSGKPITWFFDEDEEEQAA